MDAAGWRERGVEVVYRDASLLVLGKPSGLATTSPNAREDTLVKAAEALDPEAPRLHPSSRLDAEVSGLVTFARTPEATRYLLDGAIGMDPRDPRKRRVVPATELNARPSRTRFRVLARAPQAALVWLEPITGRTHQLRVHLAHEGSPLLGDRPYGGPPRVVLDDGSAFSARRVMLHCYALRLPALRAMGVDQPARAFERAPLDDIEKLASAALGIELKPLLERVLAAW